jgi:glycosyltransferase involved in cell wall biosynthesis
VNNGRLGHRGPLKNVASKAPTSLHVVTSDARRGAETFAVQLCDSLSAAGHCAEVLALAPSLATTRHPIRTLHGRRAPRTLRALRREAVNFDVVVAHGSSTLEACGLALTGTATPFVYRSIGDPTYWIGDRFRRSWVGMLQRRAQRLVALWPAAADQLAVTYRIDRGRIDTIPNAVTASAEAADDIVRHAARKAFGLTPQQPCLAYVGALSPEKDVATAIRSAGAVPGGALLIAGDGPQEAYLRTLANEVAPGRVRFLGSVDSPWQVYSAADLLLLPSRSEGMPAVLIEAGIVGTPALATAVGAVPAMIEDGQNGFLAAPQDPRGFVARVPMAIKQAGTLREGLPSKWRDRYSMDVVAERWLRTMTLAAHRTGR